MTDQYDVLIVGGGLVGATLVCALEPLAKLQGLKIAVIESHSIDEPKSRPPSFDARSSALSYGTQLTYDNLGLWSELEGAAAVIKQVHVSDRGHFGVTRLNHESEGVPALGYVIDNYRLGDVLLRSLESYSKEGLVDIFSPAEVTKLNPGQESMTATVRGHDRQNLTLKASLVVLADGGRSGLMEQLGIRRDVHGYDQYALVANVAVDKPHHGIAYERFGEKGPMALLPKSPTTESDSGASQPHVYGLVWTLSEDEVDEVSALSDSAFLQRLQENFGYRAGRFLNIGRRDCYPLSMSMAQEQVRPNLAVLGNAAHAIHPVAGQGYNLAIRGVMALADNIRSSVMAGEPIGALSRLVTYMQQQEADQKRTVAFCDGLVKVFARNESSVVLARNLGLLGLDLGGSLKSRFAKAAMGL